jgi:hypothetical protein
MGGVWLVAIVLLSLMGSSLLARAEASLTILVSPDGNDHNPGTTDAPFRTIERAQAAVRSLTATQSSDITVLLRGGTYQLVKPLRFEAQDSGLNGFRVLYRAYPGEHPIISGGQFITGWKQDREGRLRTDVGPMRFRQLYVRGVRATRARTPNAPDYLRLIRWDEEDQRIEIPHTPIALWSDLSSVELVVFKQWTQDILRLQSVREGEGRLSLLLQEPDRHKAFMGHRYLRKDAQSFYIENALEALDLPGEWHLRLSTEEVFYRPQTGEVLRESDVVVPRLEQLLEVAGKGGASVHHLTFEGLTFEYAGWQEPSEEGFATGQADKLLDPLKPNGGRVAVAISMIHADHVRFERNEFRHLGGTALGLHTGVHQIEIVGNRFEDLSAGAIVVDTLLESRPLDPRLVCHDILIANNTVQDIGREYRSSVGIFAGYVHRVRIEHNDIYDAPYSGISVGWGWTYERTSLGENRIVANRIGRVMNFMADGGGIYTLSKQPGTVISENYIYDIVRSPWAGEFPIAGIYLDEGSSEIAVTNNVLENIPLGILFHRASGNTIVNTESSFEERNHATNNMFSKEAGFLPESIKSHAGLEPAYADLRHPGTT